MIKIIDVYELENVPDSYDIVARNGNIELPNIDLHFFLATLKINKYKLDEYTYKYIYDNPLKVHQIYDVEFIAGSYKFERETGDVTIYIETTRFIYKMKRNISRALHVQIDFSE